MWLKLWRFLTKWSTEERSLLDEVAVAQRQDYLREQDRKWYRDFFIKCGYSAPEAEEAAKRIVRY